MATNLAAPVSGIHVLRCPRVDTDLALRKRTLAKPRSRNIRHSTKRTHETHQIFLVIFVNFAAQCVCVSTHALQSRMYSIERSLKRIHKDNVANVGSQRRIFDETPTIDEESESTYGLASPQGKLLLQSEQWVRVGVAIEIVAFFPGLSYAAISKPRSPSVPRRIYSLRRLASTPVV